MHKYTFVLNTLKNLKLQKLIINNATDDYRILSMKNLIVKFSIEAMSPKIIIKQMTLQACHKQFNHFFWRM